MKKFEGREPGALVVNIFGGPGCGKTTLAAEVFAKLKAEGIEAACPEEHAKLMILSGRPWLLDHQVVIAGKIWETTLTLRDKVQVIVMDSPILLCSVYAGSREPQPFHDLVRDLHGRSSHVNLLMKREGDAAYDPMNRRENAAQARRVDAEVRTVLADLKEETEAVTWASNPWALAKEIRDLIR